MTIISNLAIQNLEPRRSLDSLVCNRLRALLTEILWTSQVLYEKE